MTKEDREEDWGYIANDRGKNTYARVFRYPSPILVDRLHMNLAIVISNQHRKFL